MRLWSNFFWLKIQAIALDSESEAAEQGKREGCVVDRSGKEGRATHKPEFSTFRDQGRNPNVLL
jgi:hypothetical protein